MNRREALRQMVAAQVAAWNAEPARPAVDYRDPPPAEPLPPEVERCVLAQLELRDAAEVVLTKHALAQGLCDCQTCYDLRGLLYPLTVLGHTLDGDSLSSEAVGAKRDWHQSRAAQRNAQVRAAASWSH